MKGRELNIDTSLIYLFNKGAVIYDQMIIDISNCRNLGNRSWGVIDFLKKQHYFIIGFKKYAGRF